MGARMIDTLERTMYTHTHSEAETMWANKRGGSKLWAVGGDGAVGEAVGGCGGGGGV